MLNFFALPPCVCTCKPDCLLGSWRCCCKVLKLILHVLWAWLINLDRHFTCCCSKNSSLADCQLLKTFTHYAQYSIHSFEIFCDHRPHFTPQWFEFFLSLILYPLPILQFGKKSCAARSSCQLLKFPGGSVDSTTVPRLAVCYGKTI